MIMSDDETNDLNLDSIFPEPPRPPTPEPTFSIYRREQDDDDWKEVNIRLVGKHSLWGHYLWNSALALASYLDDPQHRGLYQSLNVLELGAGGALPSIVTIKNGAGKVVITDYPDNSLVENMEFNVMNNTQDSKGNVSVQGYLWGRPVDSLLQGLPLSNQKFDLILLSDLVFNHSQHDALLETCEMTTSNSSIVLVFYTHHRPHLADRDMEFFSKAKQAGWICEQVARRKFPPMFPEDPGEEAIRATVWGWRMTRIA